MFVILADNDAVQHNSSPHAQDHANENWNILFLLSLHRICDVLKRLLMFTWNLSPMDCWYGWKRKLFIVKIFIYSIDCRIYLVAFRFKQMISGCPWSFDTLPKSSAQTRWTLLRCGRKHRTNNGKWVKLRYLLW